MEEASGPAGTGADRPGRLTVYLGAAPGVGKTYRMLDEGHRRAEQGTDVVVGYVDCHGRHRTEQMLRGLLVIPRRVRPYRGHLFGEMDVDGLLTLHPEAALVDECAHTNVPGGRNAKRWQDVRDLLEAGIDVVTTVNVHHLRSLSDVVERITGVAAPETVPDDLVRRADHVELVDVEPEVLRRRLVHGDIYPPELIDSALTHFFRPGNLATLRELAALWAANRKLDAADAVPAPFMSPAANLRTLTALRSGGLLTRPRPVALGDVLPSAVHTVRAATGIDACVEVRGVANVPAVFADPELLERVLSTLLHYAMREAPPGATLLLKARTSARRDRVNLLFSTGTATVVAATADPRSGDGGPARLALALTQALTAVLRGTVTPGLTPGGEPALTLSLPVGPGPDYAGRTP
jgi:K+-sensing histidine kinase KdpD